MTTWQPTAVSPARVSKPRPTCSQRQQINTLNAEIKRLEAINRQRPQRPGANRTEPHTHQITPRSAALSASAPAATAKSSRPALTCCHWCRIGTSGFKPTSKETQIGRMHRAERRTDLRLSDTPIEARVERACSLVASGAQFSLLPPDNATGNFTKVVQRIPVKLTFAADNRSRV